MPTYSRLQSLKTYWQKIAAWWFPLSMLALWMNVIGLFLSARALMSMGMIGFCICVLAMPNLSTRFKTLRHDKQALALMACTALPLLSFFWSNNTHYWVERAQIMIPCLILPAMFSMYRSPHYRWVDSWKLTWILASLGGMAFSIWQYAQHKETIDAAYGFAKHMPTPFKNDHIRFSLAVCISLLFCVERALKKKEYWWWGIAFLAIVYLHWLSAKSGLIAFYGMTLAGMGVLLFKKQFRQYALLGLLFLALLPTIMYQVSTPFKNKIGYFLYSLEQMQNGEAQAQVSDEGRLISYRFAWQHIKEHPLLGVGLGDVYDTMQADYEKKFGDSNGLSLLPHNQFLMSGMSAGILTIPLWILALWLLWSENGEGKLMRRFFWGLVLFAMMIEPLFETQYGVSVFLIVGLLLRPRYYLEESPERALA